ncbi:MAG: DUF5103 domain-containing protein, partial [Hymenobacteraceae bacterium]|nr:DUF5103 domain-containing protein [Hymenobacteraceae bacterium]MDX5395626.1 DUF5103 domain-containing protein [Hymenobacteraceae bacterium]MDX5511680.1 DUF5103 domain-containing protein [Hymenobacteraceae bacterium]
YALPTGVQERYTNHQIDFDIIYGRYKLINPWQEVKVVLRQNHRWDNAIVNLKPTFVNEQQGRLEYQFFNFENNFKAHNEYRVFDTRSLHYTGIGVAKIDRSVSPFEVLLQVDKNRSGQVYSHEPDANGKRFFDNREFGSGDLDADYAWVTFQLQAAEEAPGPVYVFGALSDFQLKNDFRLQYNAELGLYTGRALLKQGYYNYLYAVKPASAAVANLQYFEGSYQQTENIYDLLVYYRPPGTRTDLVIGYEELFVNSIR